ncbi:hypothetical protein Q0812_03730 [Brevundimonas sp. 2R-24]|uniref:Lipoprotein n=1 Tax=Peiella sedimenti TaxID=3061083 RepID=A0ABT8SIY1_9CAUL|nr:hypothetical protein [Caulobacteraceae bacterium XZ-24]
MFAFRLAALVAAPALLLAACSDPAEDTMSETGAMTAEDAGVNAAGTTMTADGTMTAGEAGMGQTAAEGTTVPGSPPPVAPGLAGDTTPPDGNLAQRQDDAPGAVTEP